MGEHLDWIVAGLVALVSWFLSLIAVYRKAGENNAKTQARLENLEGAVAKIHEDLEQRHLEHDELKASISDLTKAVEVFTTSMNTRFDELEKRLDRMVNRYERHVERNDLEHKHIHARISKRSRKEE